MWSKFRTQPILWSWDGSSEWLHIETRGWGCTPLHRPATGHGKVVFSWKQCWVRSRAVSHCSSCQQLTDGRVGPEEGTWMHYCGIHVAAIHTDTVGVLHTHAQEWCTWARGREAQGRKGWEVSFRWTGKVSFIKKYDVEANIKNILPYWCTCVHYIIFHIFKMFQ